MKHTILITLLLSPTLWAIPLALREHVDIDWTYEPEDGWTCLAKTEPDGEDVFHELEEVYLPIDDAPWESGGQRFVQPAGAAWV